MYCFNKKTKKSVIAVCAAALMCASSVGLSGCSDKPLPPYDEVLANSIYTDESSSLFGSFKFNDFMGGLLQEAAVFMGAGRANYTGGAVYYTDKTAEYTSDTSKKIKALSDSQLKDKMLATNKISDIFKSIVVSFNNDKRFVMTTHYTELGVEYLNAIGKATEYNQEYYVVGTYEVARTAKKGTTEYDLNVKLTDNTKLDFVLDVSDKTVYQRNNIFDKIPLTASSPLKEAASSMGGYGENSFHEDTEKYLNIAYGNHTMQPLKEGDEGYNAAKPETTTILNDREKLDIYFPENLDKNKEGGNGVIMMIHGGSWTSGEKESMQAMCVYYTNLGYITATMNHTYAARKYEDGTLVGFAEIQDEIQAAFQKIKDMSDEHGWNITKAATCGYSSGSHLATWYAYDKGNEEDAPIPVVMTFSMVGPMSFYMDCWQDGLYMPLGPQVALIGLKDENMFKPDEDKTEMLTEQLKKIAAGELSRSEINPMDYTPYDESTYNAKLDSISPLSFVKKGDAVPTVLAETYLDTALISGQHGVQMEQALTEANIEHDVIMFANSDHVCAGNPECGKVFQMRAEQYLKKYLG